MDGMYFVRREWIEKNGCPNCGSMNVYEFNKERDHRDYNMFKCKDCKEEGLINDDIC